ncbi:XRE family transcriptional regulator [Ligilactobacillus agilis]|uniref:XRE family transcriptional regulator n=1 Tax=Ligilactobacillus agilis TaxID=1601 RepID=UPI0022E280BE|nr:XRE family transcriptional regulator [Ligilactobacillus agilis]
MREAFEIEVTTKLIKLKKSKGWLAEQVGISPAYLSDILHGNRIAEDRVRQIRKILKLDGD